MHPVSIWLPGAIPEAPFAVYTSLVMNPAAGYNLLPFEVLCGDAVRLKNNPDEEYIFAFANVVLPKNGSFLW